MDGKYTPVTITSSDTDTIVPPGVNNAARVDVYRPLPGEAPKDVTVTVTLTDSDSGVTVSRDFVIAVQPLTQQEIDSELALMAEVKAHYFDGIRNANTDPNYITTDLHAFQEVHRSADGALVWTYDNADLTGSGIVPVAMDGWQTTERWRLFRSTNPAVISHENLLVTRATEHKAVTIVSELSSETLGKYAARYPDNADFQALSHQGRLRTPDRRRHGAHEQRAAGHDQHRHLPAAHGHRCVDPADHRLRSARGHDGDGCVPAGAHGQRLHL